jgi:hypothetical protein
MERDREDLYKQPKTNYYLRLHRRIPAHRVLASEAVRLPVRTKDGFHGVEPSFLSAAQESPSRLGNAARKCDVDAEATP